MRCEITRLEEKAIVVDMFIYWMTIAIMAAFMEFNLVDGLTDASVLSTKITKLPFPV